ncbi:hypothetical protein T01_6823 [Trichinella spiralis]|uniref:Uncharacterized protein n=1 Tax=Trichinella spiralis TaxID=6334 RepID=A0A0V1B037_TRISP|nr:hypothetical protein T01_6823 [Trichinella spiralis]
MPYPILLMNKTVVHQFYSLQYLTMTYNLLSLEKRQKYSQDSICSCFVNKLLSGDVQISEKNILAQDTGRKVSIKNKLDIFRGRQMTDFIDLETLNHVTAKMPYYVESLAALLLVSSLHE